MLGMLGRIAGLWSGLHALRPEASADFSLIFESEWSLFGADDGQTIASSPPAAERAGPSYARFLVFLEA